MSKSSPRGGKPDAPAPRSLPERPSLERLRKEAKDLLRQARAGDAAAIERIRSTRRDGPAGRPMLAHAQATIAREYGFARWADLVHRVEAINSADFALRPLMRPVEMPLGKTRTLADGSVVGNDDVYAMFAAARDGDLETVTRLVARAPALATVEYNYTPPIHFAVREGHVAIANFLIEHGADLGYRSYPFKEALLTFAEDRGHEAMAALLRSRLARRFTVRPGTAAIIEAAGRGDLAAVEAELARDGSLASAGSETGDTALHHAAKQNHADIVRLLVEAGADVDATRGDEARPIHCALMPNWFFVPPRPAGEEIARYLLNHGARYNVFVATLLGDEGFVRAEVARDSALANFEDTCNERVLSAAVRTGNAALTRFLLERGANPLLPERGAPHGYSLWIAVNDGHREMVDLLLARGADPNGPIDSCGTPMLQASNRKDPQLVELMRQHGGVLPRSAEEERVRQLLEAGRLDEVEAIIRANPHWMNNEAGWGDGILAGPARDGRNDIIAMLMRLGARVPDVSKWAPYYYFKHEPTARFLFENGMNPNHMNWHRFTLLHHMAATGDLTKAALLLDHGAEINAIDDEYRSTPLGVAARWGRLEMVNLLLDRGADASVAGAPWALPMNWALRGRHGAIVTRLAIADGAGGSQRSSGLTRNDG